MLLAILASIGLPVTLLPALGLMVPLGPARLALDPVRVAACVHPSP